MFSKKTGLRLFAGTPKDRKNKAPPYLKIEIDLATADSSTARADDALSKIFPTPQDSFAELVPDYWNPCFSAGLAGRSAACRFPPELIAIPGVAAIKKGNSTPIAAGAGADDVPKTVVMSAVRNGISAPKLVSHNEPTFNEAARQVKFQGTVTRMLVG